MKKGVYVICPAGDSLEFHKLEIQRPVKCKYEKGGTGEIKQFLTWTHLSRAQYVLTFVFRSLVNVTIHQTM